MEIMVSKLYTKWGITSQTDLSQLRPIDFPILSDLYDLIEGEYKSYEDSKHPLSYPQVEEIIKSFFL